MHWALIVMATQKQLTLREACVKKDFYVTMVLLAREAGVIQVRGNHTLSACSTLKVHRISA